jgi:hypothetical protein
VTLSPPGCGLCGLVARRCVCAYPHVLRLRTPFLLLPRFAHRPNPFLATPKEPAA